jgi:hypothetical protein
MTDRDTQSGQAASHPIAAQILIIASGLVLAALVATGLYWGVVEIYHQIYPIPPNAAVSLSAGFDIAPPTQSSATPATPPAEGVTSPAATQTQSSNATEAKPSDDKGRPFFYVEGKVQKLGKPITRGMVKLTVERLIGDFRISQLLTIDESGRFYASFYEIQKNDQLRVQADVWSQDLVGEPPLTDELYLGSPAPIHVRATLYLFSGVAVLISMFVFGYAFTGPQNSIKNRVAIVYSYCVIFLFLLLPLVAPYTFVHAFPGLQKAMKETPVGLVVAKPEPDSKDSKPQWLLNLGGHVVPSKDDATVDEIVGGLAIPFYVVLLSLMGGTINMTRQVPLLQDQAQNAKFTVGFVMTAVKRLGASFVVKKATLARAEVDVPIPKDSAPQSIDTNTGDWRTGLLNQYMYLASAPFLAIATYYVLNLLGTTKVPILVIMSFSVGLISEHILVAITDFADGVIRGLKKQGQAQEPGAPQPQTDSETTVEAQEEGHEDEQDGTVKSQVPSAEPTTPSNSSR